MEAPGVNKHFVLYLSESVMTYVKDDNSLQKRL